MIKNCKYLVFIFVILFPSLAKGEDNKAAPISFFNMTSQNSGENSALSASCTGNTNSQEFDCEFTQTRVRLRLSNEEYDKSLNKFENEMKEFKKKFNSEIKKFCKGMEMNSTVERKILETEKTSPKTAKKMRDMFSICSNPTFENFYNFSKQDIEDGKVTCSISSFTPKEKSHFKRVGPNKWISVDGPSGLCNQVVTIILEKDPKHPSLWTYTQMRSHTDQGPICKDFEVGKPLIYSWQEKRSIEMKCEFIEFGF